MYIFSSNSPRRNAFLTSHRIEDPLKFAAMDMSLRIIFIFATFAKVLLSSNLVLGDKPSTSQSLKKPNGFFFFFLFFSLMLVSFYFSPSLSLSLFLSLSLSLSLCIYICVDLSMYIFIHLYIYILIHQSIHLFVHISLSPLFRIICFSWHSFVRNCSLFFFLVHLSLYLHTCVWILEFFSALDALPLSVVTSEGLTFCVTHFSLLQFLIRAFHHFLMLFLAWSRRPCNSNQYKTAVFPSYS